MTAPRALATTPVNDVAVTLTTNRPLRVLIVDDSALARTLVRRALETLPDVEVVDTAPDGVEALRCIDRHRPDVVTLDIEMPRMNGLEVLKRLSARDDPDAPKVIVVSKLTARGEAITTEALMSGAFDAIEKPGGTQFADNLRAMTLALDRAVRAVLASTRNHPVRDAAPPAESPDVRAAPPGVSPVRGVVIAISTGGPAALRVMLPSLPASLPVPVLVVQHMPSGFITPLADRLNELCPMRIRVTTDGQFVEAGTVHLAAPDTHTEVYRDPGGKVRIRLDGGPPIFNCRPAADPLFASATACWGASTLGVVMTGMGRDGTAGAAGVVAGGGRVIAQDQSTSAVYGMPRSVIRQGLAHDILPLDRIAGRIAELVSDSNRQ